MTGSQPLSAHRITTVPSNGTSDKLEIPDFRPACQNAAVPHALASQTGYGGINGTSRLPRPLEQPKVRARARPSHLHAWSLAQPVAPHLVIFENFVFLFDPFEDETPQMGR